MLFDDTKERQNESQIIRFFEQEKEKIMVGSWDVNLSFLHVT